MKLQFLGMLLVGTLTISTIAFAQEKKDEKAGGDDWAKMSEPGEHHEHLKALVGKWDAIISMQMDPKGKPVESRGALEYKSVMGGRYVTEEAKCSMFGQSFEWFGIYGYDRMKKSYTAAWVDNFGTSMELAKGECEKSGKTISYIGENAHSPSGKEKFKWVLMIEDKNSLRIVMYTFNPEGKEEKVFEIKAKRSS